jgi:hypothetical protein
MKKAKSKSLYDSSDDGSEDRGDDVLMILLQLGDEEPLYIERERDRDRREAPKDLFDQSRIQEASITAALCLLLPFATIFKIVSAVPIAILHDS